ncbi:hypothetical protein [Streptomyces sp. HUAS TT20]|uniref:hypothetical protein n=1 Tax=Streptomyces sp. HUAS TT20 TaxID=3447509 RepID=UPI0021D92DB9|nr:hypothetical protein [Streptomyces sp. HUAS 15-9]UXY28524.1 hypothetical protein N8I87_19465 [Streptomyces sp. HUAS 15-9]
MSTLSTLGPLSALRPDHTLRAGGALCTLCTRLSGVALRALRPLRAGVTLRTL